MLDETDGRESRLAKLRHMYAVKDMFDDETEAAIERAKRTVERSMYEPNSMLKERAEGMKDDLEEFHRDLRRNPVSTWIEEAEAVIAGLGGDDDPERLLKTVAELIQKLSTAPEELQDLATMADARASWWRERWWSTGVSAGSLTISSQCGCAISLRGPPAWPQMPSGTEPSWRACTLAS